MPHRLTPRTRLAYAVLLALFGIVLVYRALDFGERVSDLLHGDVHAREPFDIDLPDFRLSGVEPEAAAAGLQANDVVLRIDGTPVHHTGADLWVPLRRASAGDRMTVDVRRAGVAAPITASIELRPIRTGPVPVL